MTEESIRPWHYFLMLERDFAATSAFVEPHPLNYNTFSDKYAGLMLLIGSEVDVIAKNLVSSIDTAAPNKGFIDYQKTLTSRYPHMYAIEVDIDRYGLKSQPWSTWETPLANSPIWWKSYNKLKHSRLENIREASQKNVMNSLCGLFLLNMYFYDGLQQIWPSPELIGTGYFAPIIVDQPSKTLPDL